MSGRSPSKPGSTPRRGRTDEVGTQPADDDHDDVTDPVGLRPGDRKGEKWSEAEPLDPADPRLADAIRRLQEAQSGAWDEDSLADLKPGAEPVAQEEITGTLSRYLENALRSSLAELEEGPDDVSTEPDPEASLPGRVLANLPRSPSRPAAPSKPPPRSTSRLTRAEPPRAAEPSLPVPEPSLPVPEPSLPVPEPSLPLEATLPDLPDLEPTHADEPLEPSMPEMPDLPDLPDLPDPAGSWDEEPMSTSFDDDLGPVDEFTLSIHPELVQKAIAEAEAERDSGNADIELQSVHDDPPRPASRDRSDALRPPVTSRGRSADQTPSSSRVSSSSEVSRLRALLEEPTPADGTLPTLQDGEERTVAIPEDEPERTVAASRRSTRPEPLERSRSAPGPESTGERTMDILAAIGDMPPGHDETIGDNLERLDELMTMADAPPEGEETIGASLERLDELMSIADAPPSHEETIGASLERIDQVKRALERKKAERASRGRSTPTPRPAGRDRIQRSVPPRPSRSRAQRPPADDSLGGSLEPVDEVPQVVMPGEVAHPRPGERLTPRPPPRRPARPRAVRPSDELTQALPDKYQPVHSSSMSDEKTQALPDAYLPFEEDYGKSPDRSQRRATPPPVADRAPRPAPPPDSTSGFMRRETYQPSHAPSAPPARSRKTPPPAPPKVAPPQDFLDEDDDPYKEPILAWAATLFGFILFGGFTVLVLIAILMLF